MFHSCGPPLFFLCSRSPGAAYPEVPLLFPSSWPLLQWPQCIFSFNTKTLFILEPAFRIRQVSKYLNVWGRDTLHAFHLDRCLNYSGNKYRWWIEKWVGGTQRGSQFPVAGPPQCYCLLLLLAKSSAAASAIIEVWWNCPDSFSEYTHPHHHPTPRQVHNLSVSKEDLRPDLTRSLLLWSVLGEEVVPSWKQKSISNAKTHKEECLRNTK